MTVTCAVICVWFKLELLRRFIPLFIPKYIWLIVICIQMSLNDDVLSPTPAGNNSHFIGHNPEPGSLATPYKMVNPVSWC